MTRYATPFGAYEITPLPGQPQVVVCHGFMVPEQLRGQGHAHRLKAHQEDMVRAQHHDYALCTVAAGNLAQKRVLGAAGWVKLTEFRNRRSAETTELWGRDLSAQAAAQAEPQQVAENRLPQYSSASTLPPGLHHALAHLNAALRCGGPLLPPHGVADAPL